MANEEHVARLKQGVATWNAWRKENPDIVPNLSEANLTGEDLSEANLRKANLIGAGAAAPRGRSRSASMRFAS
jgi:uncharacterized protein YjbI with pentapeptide repeats